MFKLAWEDHRSRALLVELQTTCAGVTHHVAVANVHLEGHPERHDKRFQQLQSLLKQLSKRRAANPALHCIITGDFNNTLTQSMTAVLLEGGVSTDRVMWADVCCVQGGLRRGTCMTRCLSRTRHLHTTYR